MTTHHRHEMLQAAREFADLESRAVANLGAQLDSAFVDVVLLVHQATGKVVTTGAGTSGMVAERLAHLLSVCDTPAFYLPTSDALHGGAGAVAPQDVVIAFSKGGRSEELNSLVELLGRRDVHVVAVTEAPTSPFAAAAATVVALRTEPAEADLGGLVATGSTLLAAAWGDALTATLARSRGVTTQDVIAVHPAGAVGRSSGAPGSPL